MTFELIGTEGEAVELSDLDIPKIAKPIKLLWIPPGRFLMGSTPTELGHQHDELSFEVTLTRGYWLGVAPVTQAQYQAIRNNGDRWPSLFAFLPDSLDRPVETVSWFDATTACQTLNQRYSRRIPDGYRFALPSEAQWEFACRGGTTTRYHSGDNEQDLDRVDWHSNNSGGTSHPVQQKQPNQWGFYDLHGNVSEWCEDWYSDYPAGRVTDWIGSGRGNTRVCRGRSWKSQSVNGEFRSASRCECDPTFKSSFLGFRLCLRWG